MVSSIARSRSKSVALLLSLTNSFLSVFGDLEARRSIVFIFEKKKKNASACMHSSFKVDGRDCTSLACNQLP